MKNTYADTTVKMYVDECLPPAVADAINAKRGFKAVHASRDLGFSARDDEFHIAESRKRGAVLVTSNHRDFKHGFAYLKKHPGIVVFNTGAWTNSDDLQQYVRFMFDVLRHLRISTKPPSRDDLKERRLVISSGAAYVEDAEGDRYDILDPGAGWQPSPQVGRSHGS